MTALAGSVDFGYVKATGHSLKIYLPKTQNLPETELEWRIPKWSNALERNRARTYFQAYAAAAALYFVERAFEELYAGRTTTWHEFKVPDEAIGCGFHEAVRGMLSHHMVIRGGKIANYHPYPPTPWNASPRDSFALPGRTKMPCKICRCSRKTGGTNQGRRHHAHGAKLRPVLALRRAHVSRWWQGAPGSARAQVRSPRMTSPAPTSLAEDSEFEQRFARVEGLLAELGRSNDALLERATREVLATVLELHRRGLVRALELAARGQRYAGGTFGRSACQRHALAPRSASDFARRTGLTHARHAAHSVPQQARAHRFRAWAELRARRLRRARCERLSIDSTDAQEGRGRCADRGCAGHGIAPRRAGRVRAGSDHVASPVERRRWAGEWRCGVTLLDVPASRASSFEDVFPIADAVLYEGYVLYPYRPSSIKNRVRWNFGGVYPRTYSEAQTGNDRHEVFSECLVRGARAELVVEARFLELLELSRDQEREAATPRSVAASSGRSRR